MNKLDYDELLPGNRELIVDAQHVLGVEVKPTPNVPRGYVRHCKTGTIYTLETWLKKLRQGLVESEDGVLE